MSVSSLSPITQVFALLKIFLLIFVDLSFFLSFLNSLKYLMKFVIVLLNFGYHLGSPHWQIFLLELVRCGKSMNAGRLTKLDPGGGPGKSGSR